MAEERIEDHCYWFTHRDGSAPHAPLTGTHDTDIAIIGGGFTGLWSAYFIKKLKPEAKISLFEQAVIGYGASGRNGGEPCLTLDQTHVSAIEHFGIEEATRMACLAEQNYKEFGEFAADCDFENTGCLHPALLEEHMEAYKKLKEGAAQVGADTWQLLSKEDMQARLNSPLYVGGAFSEEGGIVNPMKVLMKLKREAEAAGVQIFENTKILKVRGSTLTVSGGVVRAQKVILATDAFGHRLFPKLLRKFVPLYDYVVVSEPLTDEQLSRIGWKGREAVADARAFFNYYRLTADNRILWGTSEAHYYPPNDVDASHDYSEEQRVALLRSFARHFPQLSDVRFVYAWGRPYCRYDASESVFRGIRARKGLLRARLYRTGNSRLAFCRPSTRTHGARYSFRHIETCDGTPLAVAVPSGALTPVGDCDGH